MFSSDGRYLAAGYSDGKVQLWNASTREPEGDRIDAGGNSISLDKFDRNICIFFPMAFSPDGALSAIGHKNNTVRLWETRTRQLKDETIVGLKTDSCDDEVYAVCLFLRWYAFCRC